MVPGTGGCAELNALRFSNRAQKGLYSSRKSGAIAPGSSIVKERLDKREVTENVKSLRNFGISCIDHEWVRIIWASLRDPLHL